MNFDLLIFQIQTTIETHVKGLIVSSRETQGDHKSHEANSNKKELTHTKR